jgi:hypothetical protein
MKSRRYVLAGALCAGLVAVAVSAATLVTKPASGGSGAAAAGPPVSPEIR